MINFKSRRGIILIASLIMVVLIFIGTIYLLVVLTGKGIAKEDYYKKQAFWLAEAGLERARNTAEAGWSSNTIGPFSDGLGLGQYRVTRVQDAVNLKKYTFTSTGYIPSMASPRIQKTIVSIVEFIEYNIGEYAISTQGNLVVKGNATVDGDVLSAGSVSVQGSASITGDIDDNTPFNSTFESVFGKTEAQLLAEPPDHIYTDPPNNQGSVDGFTWVNFSSNEDFKITADGWSGSGLLIINGGNLDIAGGTFSGIIWVKGSLRVTGNPIINGAIFVESGTEVDTTIGTGTPVITYDAEAIAGVLDDITEGYDIISWQDF